MPGMPAGLKPYPAYKPSGVEWLGEVPAHWAVTQVKRHYAIQLGKMLQPYAAGPTDLQVPYLKAQHVQWFAVRTTDAPTMWASPHDLTHYGIRAGDLLVCEGGEGGRCGLVSEVPPGYIIQNALHRVRPSSRGRTEYLQYVMSAIAKTGWFEAITSKATIAHFTAEKFGALRIPLPPLAEQVAIAHYLDQMDGRIRRYVRAKQKLLGLLAEQRQAVIHHAVTRGLEPNVCLKPSGVAWLGDVPAHWAVLPNRAIFEERNERGHPQEPMLSVTIAEGIILQRTLLEDRSKKDTSRLDRSAYKLVQPGDLAYNKMRAWQGAIGMSKYSGIVSPAYVVHRPRDGTNSRYLHYLLRTSAFATEAERWSYGIASDMWSLRPEHFKMIYACLPPLAEQTAIVAYLDKATAAIDTVLAATRREVELLDEYRTRLIADVVTGKCDVQGVAVGLPVED